MSNLHNERYDEIKSLLKKSKLLFEDNGERPNQINLAKDIEGRIQQDVETDPNTEYETAADSDVEKIGNEDEIKAPKDKVQKYRISGGVLAIHGKDRSQLNLTTDEKAAFQETMDEFIGEVSDLVDFDVLNVYQNNVDWSGKIIDEDLDFTFSIGEDSGIYINGNMLKVDQDFLDLMNKLQQFYQKFKSKWAKILANRKITK